MHPYIFTSIFDKKIKTQKLDLFTDRSVNYTYLLISHFYGNIYKYDERFRLIAFFNVLNLS